MSKRKFENQKIKQPAVLFLAKEPRPLQLRGNYDPSTKTWSNRDYESAATKKHNEAM